MVDVVLILGDQLSLDMSSLNAADKDNAVVVMAEVMAEAQYVKHHPKKIALILAAMRKFAACLRSAGWTVRYTCLDDPENTQSIVSQAEKAVKEYGAGQVIVTRPGEWRLIDALEAAPFAVNMLEDTRFIASHQEFADWAKGRKQLRMEYFYRDMRRKTGLLMEGDKPVGGKWNFDHDNRPPRRICSALAQSNMNQIPSLMRC